MSVHASLELSQQQVHQYREQGYLIIDRLFTPEECDEINARAVGVVEGSVPLAPGNQFYLEPDALKEGLVSPEKPDPAYLFKIGHKMHETDEIFRYYAMHERVADALAALIGPDIKCVQSMYIDKPSRIGVGQPYHQDSHYLKTEPDSLIAAWIACDDVDVANGGLHVIPGSQNEPIYPHDVPVDPRQRPYFREVLSARERAEIACPLAKGSAVLFAGKLLHRSGNNVTSDRRRRAYVLHYANAGSKWLNNPAARNPHLLVRGRQYPGCL